MTRKMKDSGIEWIGEIPEEWEIVQLKRFATVNNGREIENEVDASEYATPVFGSGGVFKYTDSYMYDGEAVMFGRKGTLGKPIYVNKRFWTVDTMYYLTYNQSLVAKYNYYQLLVFNWESHITQTALPSIVASEIVSCRFPIPPLDEQMYISTYLDTQCAKIDAVLEQTRQSIEEYKRLKQAVITRAVTKGIRPGRKMKDSGIEWIGEVPEGWIITVLKRYCTFKTGGTPATSNPLWFDGDLNWFTPGDFSEQYYLSESDRKLSHKAVEDGVATVIPQDTVMIIGIGGTAGKIGYTTCECCCNQQITAIICNSSIVPKYLLYWMIANTKVLKDTALYTTLPIINNHTLGRYLLIFPNNTIEQYEIAEYLDRKTDEIDFIISKKQKFLTQLESYKKSLIYEYVTGKREV